MLARTCVIALALALSMSAVHAQASGPGLYDFVAPPAANFNGVYWLNRQTGEIGVCYYARGEGDAIGTTKCLKRGDGTAAQSVAGPYSLRASNFSTERGVMRVNHATGTVSVCYPRKNVLVCTEPKK